MICTEYMQEFAPIDTDDNNQINTSKSIISDQNVSLHNTYDIYEIEETKYKDCNYNMETFEQYRVMRQLKIDPISQSQLTDNDSFKFCKIWDPYTGERTEHDDPYGPLCFDPCVLAKFFYTNRLNNLWVDLYDDENPNQVWGQCYGDGVGAGENCNIPGRGIYPEKYLFRLPVPDCYIPKDNDEQIITCGPKLTHEEIIEIDKQLQTMHAKYSLMYNIRVPPSLTKMKEYYDIAINPNPSKLLNLKTDLMTTEQINELNGKTNRNAVDCLRRMKG